MFVNLHSREVIVTGYLQVLPNKDHTSLPV